MGIYNKYRPSKLSDLVGQEDIKKYFTNAVKMDALSHAYLFTGLRGTGKTSVSRIISLIVNCENGPSIDYDIESNICKTILNNRCPDILEIDAATKTSIDDVRAMRELAYTSPVMCRKRVFIIDECHALKGAAANALLKVLEEPPKSSMFILCTTEPEKILDTIKSRCQKFTLKNIPVNLIKKQLQTICEKEGITNIEDGALDIVAKSARGSMRDALSNLESVIGFCGTDITLKDTEKIVGDVTQQVFCKIMECILSKDSKNTIITAKKAIMDGKEPVALLTSFMEQAHDMLLAKSLESPSLVYVEESAKSQWTKLYNKIELDKLSKIVRIFQKYVSEVNVFTRSDISLTSCLIDIISKI